MRNIMRYCFYFVALLLVSCSGGRDYFKPPVDELLKKHEYIRPLTIVLYDMDVEGNFSKSYKHKYKLIYEKAGEPKDSLTSWQAISKQYFFQHENNMGMEIAFRDSLGVVKKSVQPAGYSNYVGNKRYGQWVERDGNRFWEFYGKYMMMRTMFSLFATPIYYRNYSNYRTNYYGRGRSYYGPVDAGGRRRYGTYSQANRRNRPDFFQRKQQRTGWSRSYRSGRSSSGGMRSRGGGWGK